MTKILDVVAAGVISGDDVQKVFALCKEGGFALPAVNVVNTDTINAVIEAAAKAKAPDRLVSAAIHALHLLQRGPDC